jgi:protein-S-isoprenylcysteine O-methyltransferase Ste14
LCFLRCIGAGVTDTDPRRIPFPPAIPVIALLASWGLGRLWPIPMAWPNWTFWAGLVLFTVPHALGIWAHRTFRRHHTTVNPRGDVVDIMIDGPFRYTRNPMYLSLLPLYVGGSPLFHLPWAWILLLPVFFLLHFGVIISEEKYLEAKFGERYLRYKQRVRRWL